jgi:hypothetical protein
MVLLLIALFVGGCGGDGRVNARGRIVKNGQPFQLGEGEGLRIVFYPPEAAGATYESYVAVFDKADGSFRVTGKDGKGLPPGKYRVALEHLKQKKDLFKGFYSGKQTPIIREVTDSYHEIVIDLDKPAS